MNTISTLLCHAHVDLGIRCLSSLAKYHQPSIQLQIHDDGSLTDDDCLRLKDSLPVRNIIRKTEADEKVRQSLKNLPACLRYRDAAVFGIKLFDCLTLCEDEIMVYVDSDIQFLRKFNGLFDMPASLDLTASTQRGNGWSFWTIDFLKLAKEFGLTARIAEGLNAGMISIRTSNFDWDFAERFFSTIPLGHTTGLQEQSFHCAYAMRSKSAAFSSRNIRCWQSGTEVATDYLVGLHYIGISKKDQTAINFAASLESLHSSSPPVPLMYEYPWDKSSSLANLALKAVLGSASKRTARLFGRRSR